MSDVSHIRNKSQSVVTVNFDGQQYKWASGETIRMPREQASHFLRWGLDEAGNQALELLSTDNTAVPLAESEVAARKRDVAEAKQILAAATKKLEAAEQNLKIVRANQDAMVKQSTILDEKK